MFTYRSGSTLTLKVDSFDLEAGYDLLHIFEGTEAGTDIFTKLDPLKTFTIHCHTGRTDPYARLKNCTQNACARLPMHTCTHTCQNMCTPTYVHIHTHKSMYTRAQVCICEVHIR